MESTEPPQTTEESSTDYSDYTDDYESHMCDRSGALLLRQRLEPTVFWTTAALGLVGNLLVLWVYLCKGRGLCGGRGLKALTHLFLLHLCGADLLFLITLPLWASESTAGWTHGAELCKVTSWIYKVNLFAVSLFLACIAVDRYVVIIHPTAALNSQSRRRAVAHCVSVGVWMFALTLAAPELAFATTITQDDHVTCRMSYPPHWGQVAKAMAMGLQVSVGFFLPLVVMVTCYAVIGRRLLLTRTFHKHRPLLVIIAIVVVFIVTQLPHTCVLITEIWDAGSRSLGCYSRQALDQTGLVLRAVAYCHPALNPFLYALIGRRFRQEVTSLLPWLDPQKRKDFLSKTPPPKRVRTWTGSGTKSRTLSDSETSQGLSL